MPAASTAPLLYANAAGGTTVAEDRDAAADGGYHQLFMPTRHATSMPPPYQPSMQQASFLPWTMRDQGAPPCAAACIHCQEGGSSLLRELDELAGG